MSSHEASGSWDDSGSWDPDSSWEAGSSWDTSAFSPITEEGDYGGSSSHADSSGAFSYSRSPTYDTSVASYETTSHTSYEATYDSNGVPTSSSDGRLYVCLAPGCQHSPFKRVTDLDRHYKSVHVSDEDKEKYYCDYKKCPRNQEPFFRPERLRNHLRDYHKEDLPKKGTKSSAEWLRERNVQPKWWRCYTCLVRVEIRRDGFLCSSCQQVCEGDRQSLREGGGSSSKSKR